MVKYEIVKTLVYTKKIKKGIDNYADYPVCAYVIQNIDTGELEVRTVLGATELVVREGGEIVNAQIVVQDNKGVKTIYFKNNPGYTPLKNFNMIENLEKYMSENPGVEFTEELLRDIERLRRKRPKKNEFKEGKYEIIKTLFNQKNIKINSKDIAEYDVVAYVIENIYTNEKRVVTPLEALEVDRKESIINAKTITMEQYPGRIVKYLRNMKSHVALKHVSMVDDMGKYMGENKDIETSEGVSKLIKGDIYEME